MSQCSGHDVVEEVHAAVIAGDVETAGVVVERTAAYCVAGTEGMAVAVLSTYFQECTRTRQVDHGHQLLPLHPFRPCWVSAHVLAPAVEVYALDASETVPLDSEYVVD